VAVGELALRVLTQLNPRERTALIVCLVVFVAILFLSIANQTKLIHITKSWIDPDYQQHSYFGAIVIPDQVSGRCRFVQYDNKSGETRSTELSECPGKVGVDSLNNRMNAVQDNFYKK
jgi:hypothetical protein